MQVVYEMNHIKEKLREKQEKKIKELLPELIATNPVEIGIYGSYARDTCKATSDIDMYVLYLEVPKRIQKGELYELAYEKGIDLLIASEENFYETDSVFCKNIIRDRKILWRKENKNERQ